MKFLGMMFIYGGLALFYGATFGAERFDLGVLGIACVAGIPLLWIGTSIMGAAGKGVQAARDETAARIAQDPAAHRNTFFLYLRPFDTTNQFKISDDGSNLFDLDQYTRDGFDDIEKVLAESLEETLPIVALGKTGEHHGAGRIVATDEGWKSLVIALIEHANFIVLLPGDNEGTTWEMQQLGTAGALSRCLLLMPPAMAWKYRVPEGIAQRWAATTARWRTFGIELPPLEEMGGLLCYAGNGRFESAAPLPLPEAKAWRTQIQRLIDSGKLRTAPAPSNRTRP